MKHLMTVGLIASGLMLSACASVKDTTTATTRLTEVKISQQEALRQTNAWRAQHNLPPVKLDPHLTRVSQEMANHVARIDSLGTPRHSSSSLKNRTQTETYYSAAGAENLGAGYASFSAAMQGWKTSPDHNKNLLNKYVTHMGIARTNRSDGTYRNFWVMTLAAPQERPQAQIITAQEIPLLGTTQP